MKILRLSLTAFGPFTDAVLDLSGGREGLHLICGPNEAGKSSALRALRQLFFEIDARTPDNFVHPYEHLRIGAAVRNGDGSVLEFVRRKGNRNTLIAADGRSPLEEAALARYLGGLTKERFSSLFAIDHAELVAGGEALIEGRGHLGQALFATGSGLAGLLDVQRGLEREMEALFKPAGAKPRINADLAALGDATRAWREAALPSSEWAEHREALDAASARLAALEAELERAAAERHRLERLRDALPLLAERRRCLAELGPLEGVPILPEGFTEERVRAETDLDAAAAAEKAATEEIAALDLKAAALDVPGALLAEAEAIEQARGALDRYREGQAALPRLRAEAARIEHEARALLRELRPELDLEEAERLRLTRAQRATVQNLAQEGAALDAERARAAADVGEAAEQRELARRALGRLGDPADIDAGELEAVLARLRDQGDLEARLEAERRRLGQLEAQAARDLGALPLWSGTLEALDALAVPSAETIGRFQGRWREAESALAATRGALEAERRKCDEAALRIEQLRLGGEVPSDDDLARARSRRDEGWRLVRLAWKGKGPAAGEIERFAGGGDLASAFEQSLRDADALADRLRREAGRVADLGALALAHRTARERVAALEAEAAEAARAAEALRDEWSGLWAPLGLNPLPPEEMAGWARQQRALCPRAAEIRNQGAEVSGLEERIGAHRGALDAALRRLGEPGARAGEALATLRGRAEARAARIRDVEASRAELARRVDDCERALDAARRRADEAEARRADWLVRWAEAVASLGLGADASPEQAAEVIEQAATLLGWIREVRERRDRIAGIEAQALDFAAEVQALCGRTDPALTPLPCDQAVRELADRLRDAVDRRARREALLGRRAAEADRARAAREARDAATRRLAALAREARCPGRAGLPEAERLAAAKAAREARLRQLDDQLLRLAAGASIEAFAADAGAADADRLPARIAALAEAIGRLEAERSGLNQAIGREEAELRRMDGGARAAEAAEAAEQLRARIAADVDQYARLRLASAVLREGIERFRQQAQGPVLARAGALFAALTLGSFEGLRVDYDESDEPVLKGVRPGGSSAVGAEGMSDGTADQLYLALRLAVLENYLDRHDPVPFILDDVLSRFDDARALATLQALAALSRRTQVLLFTHHDHLRALAEAHLAPELLVVHHLTPRPARAGRKRK